MLRNFVRDRGTQVDARHVRRDVRVLGARARIGLARRQRLRPAPVDHRRARSAARRPRRAHLLHPPRRDVDPAARRSSRASRAISPRAIASEVADDDAAPRPRLASRAAGRRAARAHRRRRRAVPAPTQRLPPVRRLPDAGRHRDARRRRDRAPPPARALRRGGSAAGAGVAAASRAPTSPRSLERAHATGAHRTLAQDLAFAIDQLVEIAIRALSPAVNDTFTALTCIDWLGDGLCKISAQWNPDRVHRDRDGDVRVIAAEPLYDRLRRPRVRQDPPGRPRHAGRDDPPARRDREDRRVHDHRRSNAWSCCARPR